MVREGFPEEVIADFIQPELSLLLRVLAKASLEQRTAKKGSPGLRALAGAQALPVPSQVTRQLPQMSHTWPWGEPGSASSLASFCPS